LLIVVAIIAILAAIAVPTFLEAQVRSKVARVENVYRTLATALESCTVGYNRPPLSFWPYYNPRETYLVDWRRIGTVLSSGVLVCRGSANEPKETRRGATDPSKETNPPKKA